MSREDARDPRSALVHDKYFSLRPKPLERWLWQQGLPQAAERVFWLHWEEGMRNGDWCSEIPIKRVARECHVDPSTVTRAYQLLKNRGLLRREDPGRDPRNPFHQATAVTEVRLPRELLLELHRSPNRPKVPHGRPAAEPQPVPRPVAPSSTARSSTARSPSKSPGDPASHATPAPTPVRRPSRQETQAMWERASATERTNFFTASRDRHTTLAFDCDTRLTAEDQAQMLALLRQQAGARPEISSPAASANALCSTHHARKRLSVLEVARLRRGIVDLAAAAQVDETLRQMLWSMEEGALRRFATPLAINIALKKLREGAWARPNRLPPQWLARATGHRAAAETCSAA